MELLLENLSMLTTTAFLPLSVGMIAAMLSVMVSSTKKKPHSTMELNDIQNFVNAKAEVVYGGNVHAINSDCYKIGRDDSCNLAVSEKGVSGVHCEIRYKNNSFILSDLHSRNGTYVNSCRLTGDVELHNGDEINIGLAVMQFKRRNEVKTENDGAENPPQQTE